MNAPHQRRGLRSNSILVFFDSDCLMCSGAVAFLLKSDRHQSIFVAPLRGQTSLIYLSTWAREAGSIVVLKDHGLFFESQAIVAILSQLGFSYRFLALLINLLPQSFADACYRYIARHRYRLFGKKNNCFRPEPEKNFFLLP